MFDGVPADQFHQFMASSRAPLPLIPLPFSLHHQNHHGVAVPSSAPPPPAAFSGGCFDLYTSHQMLVQPHQNIHPHPQMHHHSPPPTDSGKSGGEPAPAAVVGVSEVPWSNEEVLTLLRIRSSMENWFPEYTWEHVSRKLGEHGYQRSADKCKEKFEEESRHFNTSMGYNNKNYRFFSDLDELYHHNISKGAQDLGKEGAPQHGDHEEQEMNANVGTEATTTNPSSSNQEALVAAAATEAGSRKRKREHNFEMLKGFCEAVVKKVVAQQEDLHNKLIQDMVKRDEESIAREQAWKCQEMERINKEIETRAREQVIAWERQAKIIDLLKSFTAGSSAGTGNSEEDQDLMAKIDEFFKVRKTTASATCVTSSSEIFPPASSISNLSHHHNPTSSSTTEATPSPQNQYYSSLKTCGQSPSKKSPFSPPPPSSAQKVERRDREEDQNRVGGGKRWPREEVQALINLKCQISNSGNGEESSSKECPGSSKCPLWERISQGMMELGYNRSAKRCKEKWENINKYFRKTKDSNKKRSLESRTCPYFHQLSTLYTQGTLALPAPSHVLPADQPPDHSR